MNAGAITIRAGAADPVLTPDNGTRFAATELSGEPACWHPDQSAVAAGQGRRMTRPRLSAHLCATAKRNRRAAPSVTAAAQPLQRRCLISGDG